MHSHGGGAEKVTLELARRLDAKRFKVTLIFMRHIPALADLVPEGIPFVMPERPGLWALLRTAARARRLAGASDVVLGSLQLQSIFWAALFAPGRAVGWLHNDMAAKTAQMPKIRARIYAALLAWALRRCRAIACVSRGVKEAATLLWPDLRSRLHVLWNPMNIDSIRARAQAPLPEVLRHCFGKPVLLGVGRLEKAKDFPLLLKAHALLLQRGIDHHCCILGQGSQRGRLEADIQRLGLGKSVFLPGFMDPCPVMARSAVFCLSSVHEGFGAVIVEALAVGLPVVATDCPSGPAEILKNGAYGTLVPVGDVTALADALENVLRNRAGDAHRAACLKRVEDFRPGITVKAWEELLEHSAGSLRGSV
jgi:glycosyltransferase involved in cell wall biosynthesis